MALGWIRWMASVVLWAAVGAVAASTLAADAGNSPAAGPDLSMPATIRLGSTPAPRLVPANAASAKASPIPSALPEPPSEPPVTTRQAAATSSEERATPPKTGPAAAPAPESLKPIPDPQNGSSTTSPVGNSGASRRGRRRTSVVPT